MINNEIEVLIKNNDGIFKEFDELKALEDKIETLREQFKAILNKINTKKYTMLSIEEKKLLLTQVYKL